MSKYSGLASYLRAQDKPSIAMTFADVERIIGTKLPASAARHRAWWSNNPDNNVATKEWLAAGYVTEQVDINKQVLVFRRIQTSQLAEGPAPNWGQQSTTVTASPGSKRHPLFGALKGLVRVTPGTDLTEPLDLEWGKS